MRIRSARFAALLAGVALFCSAPVAVTQATAAPRAQADSVVSCQANGTLRFTPGVTLIPKTTNWNFTGHAQTCTGLSPSGSPVVSASVTVGITARTSCEGGLPGGPGVATIEWRLANGEILNSTAEVHANGRIINHFSFDGTITSGLFTGEQLHGDMSLPLLNGALDCVSQLPVGGMKLVEADLGFNVHP